LRLKTFYQNVFSEKIPYNLLEQAKQASCSRSLTSEWQVSLIKCFLKNSLDLSEQANQASQPAGWDREQLPAVRLTREWQVFDDLTKHGAHWAIAKIGDLHLQAISQPKAFLICSPGEVTFSSASFLVRIDLYSELRHAGWLQV
jgi:hypothetical protein